MKRIIDNGKLPEAKPKVADPVISDISIDSLISDSLLGLYREVKNLLILSSQGKLDAADARDLRDTVKLLFELKDREKDILEALNEEAIQNLNDNQSRT